MKIFILFLGLSLALISCAPRDLEKSSLIPCFRNADTNNNNELDVTEITNFLNIHITMINTTQIMSNCDLNSDGKLTMEDLNSTNSCIERRLERYLVCKYCNDMFNK